ncbi:hypothetical protein KQX54_005556 [Cotesia glomerata]|uniref:Uncharacterized protein n=1 Tax=Cotesia glomerata TaxID=32391 RepID=A0AAV7HSF2_COTGL|nr:hypothetical protein KQX54_005556 [Cotesia glomerata]
MERSRFFVKKAYKEGVVSSASTILSNPANRAVIPSRRILKRRARFSVRLRAAVRGKLKEEEREKKRKKEMKNDLTGAFTQQLCCVSIYLGRCCLTRLLKEKRREVRDANAAHPSNVVAQATLKTLFKYRELYLSCYLDEKPNLYLCFC